MRSITLDPWQKKVLNTKGHICLCSGRQTGKSTIIAHKEGEYAATNPGKSVLIISATERQAEELFIKVLLYLDDHWKDQIKKGKDRPTKSIIKLKNGSIIRCLPTGLSGIGIRGFTVDHLVADEAAFIPDEVWQAVTPMLLTTGGDIILVSTPKGKQGYFYECYKSDKFKTYHVNSEEVIRKRKISETWTKQQLKGALERLEMEKQSMSTKEYAQEYLGQFVEDLAQLFSDQLIMQTCTLSPQPAMHNENYFLGVDVARLGGDETTFEIIRKVNKKRYEHVSNQITKKTLTTQTVDTILELNKQWKFKKIYVDDAGVGAAVFDPLLMHPETSRKVVPINNARRALDRDEQSFKRLMKEELYMNLLAMMEKNVIKLLNDDDVAASLKSVQYEYLIKQGSPTRLRIFGSYTHIAEGLIRAAWANRDKTLNIWATSYSQL